MACSGMQVLVPLSRLATAPWVNLPLHPTSLPSPVPVVQHLQCKHLPHHATVRSVLPRPMGPVNLPRPCWIACGRDGSNAWGRQAHLERTSHRHRLNLQGHNSTSRSRGRRRCRNYRHRHRHRQPKLLRLLRRRNSVRRSPHRRHRHPPPQPQQLAVGAAVVEAVPMGVKPRVCVVVPPRHQLRVDSPPQRSLRQARRRMLPTRCWRRLHAARHPPSPPLPPHPRPGVVVEAVVGHEVVGAAGAAGEAEAAANLPPLRCLGSDRRQWKAALSTLSLRPQLGDVPSPRATGMTLRVCHLHKNRVFRTATACSSPRTRS